jgi:hypothetical protein
MAIPNDFCQLLKVRSERGDRFIVLELETLLLQDHEQNLNNSLSELEARRSLKSLGFTDAEVDATVSDCLRGHYYDEPEA